MSLRNRLLHADELVCAHHVACHPHDHARGALEAAAADFVAFPVRGVFVKHLDDGREVIAHAGQAVFFNAGESYRVSHPCGGDDCFVLQLARPVLAELLEVFDPGANERDAFPFRASHAPLALPKLLQQRLLWKSLHDAHDALEIEECALELVAAALSTRRADPPRRPRPRASAQRRRREQVRAATIALADRPTHPWSLATLARQVHASPFHLARVFRNEHGASIHQYLLQVRLAHALDVVLDSRASLTTIALETGFATPSHFTATFRARYGMTPSELRRGARPTTARELRRNSTASMTG